MFDSLSTRLEGIVTRLRGKGRLSEADVDEILKEIRTALLEADVNVGVLVVFAITSMGVYGIVLAGWSSNSKYSLLGGLRSSAQMISYELAYATALASVVMLSGSLSLREIVNAQAGTWSGFIPRWYLFLQPVGFTYKEEGNIIKVVSNDSLQQEPASTVVFGLVAAITLVQMRVSRVHDEPRRRGTRLPGEARHLVEQKARALGAVRGHGRKKGIAPFGGLGWVDVHSLGGRCFNLCHAAVLRRWVVGKSGRPLFVLLSLTTRTNCRAASTWQLVEL